MACPQCGDQCHCAEPALPSHISVLIDPEQLDDSEQQFAASVEEPAGDGAVVHDVLAVEEVAIDDEEPLGDLSGLGSGTPIVTPQIQQIEQVVETVLIEAAVTERPVSRLEEELAVWRDEVSNRVEAYRTKRGRPRRGDIAASLNLFDAEPEMETAAVPARYAPVKLEVVEKAPESNLIEFPKPAPVASAELPPPPPVVEELAEPILESPRILDVPEGTHEVPEQPLADIKLDEPAADPVEHVAAAIELPLPVAPMAPRIAAGMIDLLVVLTMVAVFGIIFMIIARDLPAGTAAGALLLFGALWASYHYVFLDQCATTPGMQIAQLGLTAFPEDKPVTRRQRRARALAMAVSAMSLWLGFAWTFLDADQLSWHDRISHTFLANE